MTKERAIFILVGAPGAGKTTWAKKQKIPLVNIDLKRKTVVGDWAINPSEKVKNKAFELGIKEAKDYLKNGKSFIWDGTNVKRDRQKIIHALMNYTDSFVAVVFTTPLEECLRRNKSRSGKIDKSIIIDRFNSLLIEPVKATEGFEKIVYI